MGGLWEIWVHNVLEPATFGVPIVIGSNYSHFAEAIALVNMGVYCHKQSTRTQRGF
jgi:3-deoxy-D-manno-octulosonic-acid transferase